MNNLSKNEWQEREDYYFAHVKMPPDHLTRVEGENDMFLDTMLSHERALTICYDYYNIKRYGEKATVHVKEWVGGIKRAHIAVPVWMILKVASKGRLGDLTGRDITWMYGEEVWRLTYGAEQIDLTAGQFAQLKAWFEPLKGFDPERHFNERQEK